MTTDARVGIARSRIANAIESLRLLDDLVSRGHHIGRSDNWLADIESARTYAGLALREAIRITTPREQNT